MPCASSAVATRGVAEAGDRDDAAIGRRAAGHAGQGRAHLAADAEQHDVAVDRREVGLHLGRRPREELLQLRDVARARAASRASASAAMYSTAAPLPLRVGSAVMAAAEPLVRRAGAAGGAPRGARARSSSTCRTTSCAPARRSRCPTRGRRSRPTGACWQAFRERGLPVLYTRWLSLEEDNLLWRWSPQCHPATRACWPREQRDATTTSTGRARASTSSTSSRREPGEGVVDKLGYGSLPRHRPRRAAAGARRALARRHGHRHADLRRGDGARGVPPRLRHDRGRRRGLELRARPARRDAAQPGDEVRLGVGRRRGDRRAAVSRPPRRAGGCRTTCAGTESRTLQSRNAPMRASGPVSGHESCRGADGVVRAVSGSRGGGVADARRCSC